jgi:hypothetical protein
MPPLILHMITSIDGFISTHEREVNGQAHWHETRSILSPPSSGSPASGSARPCPAEAWPDRAQHVPNDGLSVAIVALRSRTCRQVTTDDPAVLQVWSRRHRDLARARNQVACRLHAVLCDLVPGGHQKEISASPASSSGWTATAARQPGRRASRPGTSVRQARPGGAANW